MWSVWDTKKGLLFIRCRREANPDLSSSLSRSPGSLMSGAYRRWGPVKTQVGEENFWASRTTSTQRTFQSGAQAINKCGLLSLSTGTTQSCMDTHKHRRPHARAHTHTERLASPLWLPPSTQYTHHNDLARPPPHIAYIYSTAIYPLALTTHRLCHCGFFSGTTPYASAHLPGLPVTHWTQRHTDDWCRLTAQKWDKALLKKNSIPLKWLNTFSSCYTCRSVKRTMSFHRCPNSLSLNVTPQQAQLIHFTLLTSRGHFHIRLTLHHNIKNQPAMDSLIQFIYLVQIHNASHLKAVSKIKRVQITSNYIIRSFTQVQIQLHTIQFDSN